MKKQGCFIALCLLSFFSSGCIGELWTGASIMYDRHHLYKKVSDIQLNARTTQALEHDKRFKCADCYLDLAVFNGDVLVAGHLPTEELLAEASARLMKVSGARHMYNQIRLGTGGSGAAIDSWITTKIRSRMFMDDSIDPNSFKIVTVDQIVYLMGNVKSRQAKKVIQIARQTNGVVGVVKMLRYYTYKPQLK